jgi:site-specific DNA recombinase
MNKIRCAIYTRKSSEEGLEQEFNSLDAQREACAAYITSQKHEGWVLLPEHYDDGGISGGTLERPALQRLLQHIEDGLVDQIIVYKIDRLTRSLGDFSKIVDTLDAADTSFVSVTQSFNTATSMGRLTLNMLLSFVQFEREVTAERIRDKIAASKRKGLWMGGNVPMGYDPNGRTLAINEVEARIIRTLYDLYEQHGTVRLVKEEADQLQLWTRQRETTAGKKTGGGPFDRGHIHHILTNPIYAGKIRHRKDIHEGQHEAIIAPERWDQIQEQLKDGAAKGRVRNVAKQTSLLCGKLFDETGDKLTPSHTKTSKGVRLRYYVSHRLIKRNGESNLDGWRLPALELETKVANVIRSKLTSPSFINQLIPDATISETGQWRASLKVVCENQDMKSVLDLVHTIKIKAGELQIALGGGSVSHLLSVKVGRLESAALTITSPFQIRKRGVETKLVLGDGNPDLDETLIQNAAKAHQWFERIKAGQTLSDVAKASGTSSRRIQQIIELAFLAPDVTKMILDGNQPLGFTSEWVKQHSLPSNWQEQRAIIATL